jgi:hypothetical protein
MVALLIYHCHKASIIAWLGMIQKSNLASLG